MNRTLKTFGLSVIAVLALAGLSAASASATSPEFEPEDETFTVPFTGHGGVGTLETHDGHAVECESTEVTGGKIVNKHITKEATVTYHGCRDELTSFTCTSAGQSSGTIVTNKIEGENVYTGANKDETSVLLKPESGTVFAEFQCFTVSVTVEGSVLGHIAPLNPDPNGYTKEFTLSFSQTEGTQDSGISYWDTKTCETKEGFLTSQGEGFGGWEHQKSGIEGSVTLTSTEPVRINSSECEEEEA